jgi:uncharacterized protein with GYD domain
MAKFLIKVSYSKAGIAGVRKEGATPRAAYIAHLVETIGGNVESLYYAFGPDDVVLIVDVPDNKTAMAFAATVGSSDAISSYETVPLLTTEEVDAALKMSVGYRPPGA